MKIKTAIKLDKKFKINARIVSHKIFNEWYYDGDLDRACEQIKKYRGVIRALIRFYDNNTLNNSPQRYTRCSHKKYKRKYGWTEYPDTRKGDETYGYKSLDSINGNLSYISDRFGCSFRMRWLIEVPERVEQLKRQNNEI